MKAEIRVGVHRHAPAAVFSGQRAGTHCAVGWVSPRAGLELCRKSRPPLTRIRYPNLPKRKESLHRLRYPGPEINMLI